MKVIKNERFFVHKIDFQVNKSIQNLNLMLNRKYNTLKIKIRANIYNRLYSIRNEKCAMIIFSIEIYIINEK